MNQKDVERALEVADALLTTPRRESKKDYAEIEYSLMTLAQAYRELTETKENK